MSSRQLRRGSFLGIFAVALVLVGCSGDPTGAPYRSLGRDMAGVYNGTLPASERGFWLTLGTRHTVSGRYEDTSGELVRFEGTWDRRGDILLIMLSPQDGLPSEFQFDITREKIYTELERSPFSMRPETDPPDFLEQDIMKLSGVAVVAGVQTDLELTRIILDVVGGGGLTAN